MDNENKESTDFSVFGLNAEIMEGIEAAGFKTPSPVQSEAIPVVLEGRDVIAQAHTGTGKTAAFALPAMNNMDFNGNVEMLIMTPTRELAAQVSDEIYRLGQYAGVRTGTVCGGKSYSKQLKMFQRGMQVLTATPGRLLDLLNSGKISLNPSIVVLDEADEMLDMGFLEDIQEIFTFLPEKRQTLFFSATMPEPIQRLAGEILNDPVRINTITTSNTTAAEVEQLYFVIAEHEREHAIVRLIDEQVPDKAIVFCRTRLEVDRLSTSLGARGYSAKGLHGDMDQPRRTETMNAFRKGVVEILVATDVAARGLDVHDVSHVFNYHLPFDSKSYVHRVGRTGRAGRAGIAITLVTVREYRQLDRIRQSVGAKMEHREIPGLEQLRLSRMERLREQLLDCSPLREVAEMADSLGDEFGAEELNRRLLTFFLESQGEDGPERIGLTEEEFRGVLKSSHNQGRRRSGGGNFRRRRRDDRRGGGGGDFSKKKNSKFRRKGDSGGRRGDRK